MAFDSSASCTQEEVFHLPVCLQNDPDTILLHTAIVPVVAWMASHHLPKDPYDAPYVYRTYMTEWISANDVAALGRIAMAASMRSVPLPALLQPLLPASPSDQVKAGDVTYVAANAVGIAAALPALLAAMQTDLGAPADVANWWALAGIAAGAVAVGIVVAIVGERKYEDHRVGVSGVKLRKPTAEEVRLVRKIIEDDIKVFGIDSPADIRSVAELAKYGGFSTEETEKALAKQGWEHPVKTRKKKL